jgi:hypothetical protein
VGINGNFNFSNVPSTTKSYSYKQRALCGIVTFTMTYPQMDNSGSGQLQVPGFGDIPIDYELATGESFAHGALPNHESRRGRATRLTITEIFILRTMERLMGISNWEHDIIDENIVAQWYAVVLSESKSTEQRGPEADDSDVIVDMDLVSQAKWNWCIAELQDKARDLRKHNFVLTLNADSGVCKSDQLVGELFQNELQEFFVENHLPCDRRGVSNEKDDMSPMYDP